MKKLFALMMVAALAAIGCDDKKSSPKAGTTPTMNPQRTTEPGGHRTTEPGDHKTTEPGANKTTESKKTTDPGKKPDGPVVPDPKKGDGKDGK